MRTTLVIDDDILRAAKVLARERRQSIGAVVSELARKGLMSRRPKRVRSGLPVFQVPEGAHAISLDDVKRLEDIE